MKEHTINVLEIAKVKNHEDILDFAFGKIREITSI